MDLLGIEREADVVDAEVALVDTECQAALGIDTADFVSAALAVARARAAVPCDDEFPYAVSPITTARTAGTNAQAATTKEAA